jgi:FixJ family two-component response regulator
MRRGLKRQLWSAGLAVETYASAETFLEDAPPDPPGCLILDVRLPGLDGLDLQKRMAEADLHLPIIFITGFPDVSTAVNGMKEGAVDFLTKPFDDQELLATVREAIEQGRAARRERLEREEIRDRVGSLTPRQRQVFRLVVTGMTNRAIANRLTITVRTVKAHRAAVMRKMEAESLADLVHMAEQIDLEPPEE